MSEEERAALREEVRKELLAEMQERDDKKKEIRAELEEEVRDELRAELEAETKRKRELAEFAEEICGGDAGLSEKPEDVVAFLEGVPEEQLELAQQMLKAKVVEFEERGSSRDGLGDKAELEAPFEMQIREWLDAGRDLEEWFEMNEDVVGEMDQYNVSEFMEEEE